VGEGCDVEVLVMVGLAAMVGVPCAWLHPVIIITSTIHKVKLAAKRISFWRFTKR
jgi:cobalamin biosynthesis protein CobD/CbiB